MPGRYQQLSADHIIATLEKLHARMVARFPDAGLGRVCAELIEVGRASVNEAAELARPDYLWRGAACALVVAGLIAQVAAFRFLHLERIEGSAPELLQGLEAAVSLLILFGSAVWFVLTLEERIKRQRVLDALHRLRSMAHIVDMHQLTKDPTIVLDAQKTPASPERTMSHFELTRYLDYCSEMLALIGKLSALYAERMRDGVVIEAVNDMETLTTGLGRKIWQKITLIGVLEDRAP
ncbi:hypothetical protein [Vitreimonas flagellata]|uniref:hypothetical protein n=1 Tax=Vitreimonas flagellata TaxID=2560861 RepID=UPI001074C260|nr:hypothetical protein [Vitreimonas flagellata]